MPTKHPPDAAVAPPARSGLLREAELWRRNVSALRRLTFLGDMSRALSQLSDPDEIFGQLAALAVPAVADWCVIDRVDEEGRVRLAAVADVDPNRAALLREIRRRFPPEPGKHPAYRVARARRPMLIPRVDDSVLKRFSSSPHHWRLLKRLGAASYVSSPVKAGRRVVAVLSFGRAREELTQADLALASDIALRTGAALEKTVHLSRARRAESQLARALAANRMVAWSWDGETGLLERSPGAADVLGVDGAGADLPSALALVHEADRAGYEARLAQALAQRTSYVARFRVRRRDGSVAWMEEHGKAEPGERGMPRLSAVAIDVTEGKLAGDQARLQADLARLLSEPIDEHGALARALAAIGQTMGWSGGHAWLADEAARLRPAAAWSAERPAGVQSRPPISAGVARAWTTGQATALCHLAGGERGRSRLECSFAFALAGSTGRLGVVELAGEKSDIPLERFESLLDALGRQIGLFLERRRAEVTLERQRREQEEILDAAPAMIWYKDARNRILRCNRAAAEWAGRPRSEIEGRTAEEIFPDRGAAYGREDAAVMRSGRPRLGLIERAIAHDGNSVWVRRDIIPRFDAEGRPVGTLVCAVDVTEIKRAEEALAQSECSQRDFVANVSHEFRTPVAAIKGFAETLRTGGLEDAENRLGFVRTIESHADRLDWLVQDLLNLARLGSGMVVMKRDPLLLRPFVAEYLGSVASLAERSRVAFEVRIPPLLRARGDRPHLVQVLDNLVSNALKHSPEGSRIVVEGRRDGRFARLTVRDRGRGIAAEHLPRLFDRFYRVEKGDGGGQAGLGLHIVKTIVETLGGRAWAESQPGKGSAFHFTLPR